MKAPDGSDDDAGYAETAAAPTPPPPPVMGAVPDLSSASRAGEKPPAEVPGYQLVRLLGRGAFGVVWLAQQKNTGKQVAIKFYAHAEGLDLGEIKREVWSLAALYAAREIVQLIEVGWEATPPYFVMEYLEHGSLEQRLRRQPLAVPEAVRIFRAIAQALTQAHSRGILHCDLKPANVLLDGQLRPRLADFGQSRLSSELSPSLGTFYYMAPEQARLDAVPDARWDVYALGALLYAMLTGDPPHRTLEGLKALQACAGRLADRLSTYRELLRSASPQGPAQALRRAHVEAGLREIVSRCLAQNPDERYQSVQAVLEALDAHLARKARWPLLILGALGPVLLLFLMAAVGWQSVLAARNASTAALSERALESCRFAARFVAAAASREVDRRWEKLEAVAADPALRVGLVALADPEEHPGAHAAIQEQIQRLLEEAAGSNTDLAATSWFLSDASGLQWARTPRSDTIGKNWAHRDYFHGLGRELSPNQDPALIRPIRAPHRSAVFNSKATGTLTVAFSVPVWSPREKRAVQGGGQSPPLNDDAGSIVGVLGMTVALGHFGELHPAEERPDAHQMALLIDTRADWTRETGLVLQHPELSAAHAREQPIPIRRLPPSLCSQMTARRQELPGSPPVLSGLTLGQDYFDPMVGPAQGRWLAVAEPVLARGRDIGWVVIVEEPYSDIINPISQLGRRLFRIAALGFVGVAAVLTLLWGIVVHMRTRSLKRKRQPRGPESLPQGPASFPDNVTAA